MVILRHKNMLEFLVNFWGKKLVLILQLRVKSVFVRFLSALIADHFIFSLFTFLVIWALVL